MFVGRLGDAQQRRVGEQDEGIARDRRAEQMLRCR